MQIYLPIAEMSVDIFLLLGMGGLIGFLSGIFGVGGGFLMTPLLIFLGIPPTIAVATGAHQITASSVSGVIGHWQRGSVDFKMGMVLLAGGFVGSTLGVLVFAWLRSLGQIDFVIRILYVGFLGTIGFLMLAESIRAMLRQRRQPGAKRRLHEHTWIHGLPFKMRFRRSRLYISALVPLAVGALVGILAAVMGVGGGFLMVPAMIYLIGMPTSVVVGTSLFQIIFVTANVTFMQAVQNHTVDIVLSLLLMVGGVIGAQLGARAGTRLRGEELRSLLALMVLAVCTKLFFDLIATPAELYSLSVEGRL